MIDEAEIIDALMAEDVDIPLCNQCGEEILIFKKKDRGYALLNLNFTDHQETCARPRSFKPRSYID
jgi:hypothetical protein